MPKEVIGWLAEDNEFFEREQDAELYEAENALRDKLDKLNVQDDKFIEIATALQSEVQRYFNAIKSAGDPEEYQADDKGRDEDTASAQQQQTRGNEPVPDMGSGSQSEGVR